MYRVCRCIPRVAKGHLFFLKFIRIVALVSRCLLAFAHFRQSLLSMAARAFHYSAIVEENNSLSVFAFVKSSSPRSLPGIV
ncbi:hypothetical protein F5X97DRAFT_49181 [Nemania serpens]|nr:hypothetical protein F5X97DRAFT_49181 [Nemania serpens]